ncbi:hypothetical protein ACM614_15450 [Streptomyces sp. 12297]
MQSRYTDTSFGNVTMGHHRSLTFLVTPDPQHVPQLPQEETDLIRAWHELGYETARQEAASGDPAFARSPMDRGGLRRTVVDRLRRERDGRPVEHIAHRLSR